MELKLTLEQPTQVVTEESWNAWKGDDSTYQHETIGPCRVDYCGHLPMGMVIVAHDDRRFVVNQEHCKEYR